jgi:hypothetical protein
LVIGTSEEKIMTDRERYERLWNMARTIGDQAVESVKATERLAFRRGVSAALRLMAETSQTLDPDSMAEAYLEPDRPQNVESN